MNKNNRPNDRLTNINLFIKKLKESELDLISKFYSQTAYIDSVIKTISDNKNNTLEVDSPLSPSILGSRSSVEQVIPPGSQPQNPIGQVIPPGSQPQNPIGQMMPPGSQLRIRLGAQSILKDVSKKTEFIYNTPAVDKLRGIAEKKWYNLF